MGSQQNELQSKPHFTSIQIHSNPLSKYANEDVITVNIPGSKSITNRILLLAALGHGQVRIRNFLKSNDTIAMLNAMKKLGIATFEYEGADEHTIIVNGNGGEQMTEELVKNGNHDDEGKPTLHVANSGTAARFLTSLAVVLSGKRKQTVIVTGNEQIKKRPIESLVDALLSNGCKINYDESPGKVPLSVQSLEGFPGGHLKLDARISSQYVSSILMAAPYANEPVTLELDGHIISRSYIDMTIALMKSFGVNVTQSKANIFHIPKATYTNPPEFIIEPDASTSTYPMAVAAIMGRKVKIPFLGKRSIQGDAGFAPVILAKMGCKVIQTDDETIVHGPPVGTLASLGQVDMEPFTDSFLTATVLAAVVKDGKSTIIGIANQRVKECNRISAMVSQLAKYGVKAKELDDGIIIYGQDYSSLKCHGSVHCFDDHRVAMSFSVLGCLVPCIIRDRYCTKKTWPEWWDVLNGELAVQLSPVDIMHKTAEEGVKINSISNNSSTTQCTDKSIFQVSAEKDTPSIILIGMRGVGKTTIGRNVAKLLSKHYIDFDEEFEKVYKTGVNKYITENGYDAFRQLEIQLLINTTSTNPKNCVISCGGGIVETAESRLVLQNLFNSSSFIIIHLVRDLQDVMKEASFHAKAAFTEDVNTIYNRRFPLYQQFSHKEFYITNSSSVEGEISWKEIELQVARFVQNSYFPNYDMSKLIKSKTSSPTLAIYSIKCKENGNVDDDVQVFLAKWKKEPTQIQNNVRLLELRITATDKYDSAPELQKYLSVVGQNYFLLKRITNLPLILTCISTGNPSKPSNELQFTETLIKSALKWNVDILCLNEPLKLKLGSDITSELISSKVITSTWQNDEMIKIDSHVEETLLQNKLLVSANGGNHLLKNINSKLIESNELTPKQFYLLGSPISKSKSPLLHNTGFQEMNLPYNYQLHETDVVDSNLIQLIKNPNFGGASVTIPLKEKIGAQLYETTTAGKAIGAINTLYVNEDGKLVGHNTDYIGMLRVMENTIQTKMSQDGNELRGLIIGGGGTARAAIWTLLSIPQIKYITIVNRSVAKAQGLAQEFSQHLINKNVVLQADSLESLFCSCHDDLHHPHIIISTIPPEAQLECKFSKELFKYVQIVIEMVYGRKTPVLQAVEANSSKDHVIEVYDGAQVLVEQGLEAFEIWTGLRNPFELMRSTVLNAFAAES